MGEVGHGHGRIRGRIAESRRPDIGQFDAVVEFFRLRAGGLVRPHEQLRVLRHDLAREHVLLAEFCHQDLCVRVPVPVIEDVNQAVRCLEAIGIRHRVALIQQQTAFPRLAFVLRKPRAHVHALLQSLGGRSVLHEQNAAGFQAAQEEARVDVLHRRGLLRRAPCRAAIAGKALVRLALRAGQHPEAAVLQLDHHVLVELPIRELHAAAFRPRRAFVGRGKNARRAGTERLLLPVPDRHWQQPCAILEHGRLVQRAAFRKHHRRAPHRVRRIGIIAAHEPVRHARRPPPPLGIAEILIKKEPQASFRIGPQIAHMRTVELRSASARADRQPRLRPGRAIVITRRQQEITVRLVPRPCPKAPDAPLRRTVHP